jgi:type IV pilus assembly protein PilA
MKAAKGSMIVELIITTGIVIVLIAIAIPAYQRYTRRTDFHDIVKATAPYKLGVVECYKKIKKLSGCHTGTNHIPAAPKANTDGIASLSVKNGVITVIPVAQNGVDSDDTYILTPAIANSAIVWTSSGPAVTKHYAK